MGGGAATHGGVLHARGRAPHTGLQAGPAFSGQAVLKPEPVVVLPPLDLFVKTSSLVLTQRLGLHVAPPPRGCLCAAPLLRRDRPRTSSKQGSSTPSHGRERTRLPKAQGLFGGGRAGSVRSQGPVHTVPAVHTRRGRSFASGSLSKGRGHARCSTQKRVMFRRIVLLKS